MRFIVIAAAALAVSSAGFADEPEPADIMDTLAVSGAFATLTDALEAAGLDAVLSGRGPFTVFAPHDSAFDALPAGTMDSLMRAANAEHLEAVLGHHVARGALRIGDLAAGEHVAPTLNGSPLIILVADDGAITVDGAGVIAADIETANGVIHVLDTVAIPR